MAALKHFNSLTLDDVRGHVRLHRLSSCLSFSSAACQRAAIWGTVFAHAAHDNHSKNGCKSAELLPQLRNPADKAHEETFSRSNLFFKLHLFILKKPNDCRNAGFIYSHQQLYYVRCSTALLSLVSGKDNLLKFQLSHTATLRQGIYSRTDPSRPDLPASHQSIMKDDGSNSAPNQPNSD